MSYEAFTHDDEITFGKYSGTKMGDVPPSYLLWLWNNGVWKDSVVIAGLQVMWGGGNKDKPMLPLGYAYIEQHREWLIAISPTGRRYYVSRERLYRQERAMDRLCDECRQVVVKRVINMDETIELPQRQLT